LARRTRESRRAIVVVEARETGSISLTQNEHKKNAEKHQDTKETQKKHKRNTKETQNMGKTTLKKRKKDIKWTQKKHKMNTKRTQKKHQVESCCILTAFAAVVP